MHSKKRVGIFGSAFYPPHIGHHLLVERALETLAIEKIIVIPTADPVHKRLGEGWSSEDRLFLTKVAFYTVEPGKMEGFFSARLSDAEEKKIFPFYRSAYGLMWDSRIVVSDIEFKMRDRGIAGYTVNTLRELLKQQNFEPVLLIGADQALVFDIWKEFEFILKHFEVVVATRANADREKILQKFPTMHFLDWRGFEVSSTEIRERWCKQRSIRYLVSPMVETILETSYFKNGLLRI